MNLIFFIVFLLSVIIQIYFVYFFAKFIRFKISIPEIDEKQPVSVIICAKDEAENLKNFLPFIYKQNYPVFEVVLINDRSIDHTREIMQEFKEKYPGITRVVNVPVSNDNRLRGNKKYALTLGIKAAKFNRLLFTDADCKPASENWIQLMQNRFSEKKQIVLGYGKYQKTSGFLNKLIRYETLQTAIQYFSYALNGMPYMGVGRNLAYTKELFMQNNGFYSHLDILSGDDDLFVNEAATTVNTTICIHPDSFTLSLPKQNLKSYIHQKRRHISTANKYKLKFKILLGLYYFSLVLFWLTAVISLLLNGFVLYIIGMIFVRFTSMAWIQHKSANKLQEEGLIYWFPLLEISLILFQFYIFVINLIQKPKYWTK
jgi:glycosyltransferase involved in cell wall biosynthesis